jgi:hypothetical protein
MGGSYFSMEKITSQSLRGYEDGRAVVSAQSKPVAKTEEELKQEELTAILGRVEALLGVKVAGHVLIDDPEEENGKEGIWIKYVGQKNDSRTRKEELIMKLVRNSDEALNTSKYFDLVDIV